MHVAARFAKALRDLMEKSTVGITITKNEALTLQATKNLYSQEFIRVDYESSKRRICP